MPQNIPQIQTLFFGSPPGDKLREQGNPKFFKTNHRLLKYVKLFKCTFFIYQIKCLFTKIIKNVFSDLQVDITLKDM